MPTAPTRVAEEPIDFASLSWPSGACGGPAVLRPGHRAADGSWLCRYNRALAWMEALIARPADAPDVLLSVEHPPTITLGRRGGREHVLGRQFRQGDGRTVDVEVHEVARGGSVTWHAPGQLVVYPIVQIARLQGPVGRGPLGDLPGFARLLETALQGTCLAFGLETSVRPGFTGLWLDETHKLASIGVALRGGWTWHGLALDVCADPAGFDLVTPCGLAGVRMANLADALAARGLPRPDLAAVEVELLTRLAALLPRRE